ncbi:rCG41983 [Rattus norvegicus]|uniref:RCG41983 n=1 Tax=Rattus norvegicus TaxID=10116 RepID=A6JUX9_RAT|nr:rCG41983 [Rattus norvegicus]
MNGSGQFLFKMATQIKIKVGSCRDGIYLPKVLSSIPTNHMVTHNHL